MRVTADVGTEAHRLPARCSFSRCKSRGSEARSSISLSFISSAARQASASEEWTGGIGCRGLALSTTNHTSAEAAEGTAMKNRPGRDTAARSFPVNRGVGSFSGSFIQGRDTTKSPANGAGDCLKGGMIRRPVMWPESMWPSPCHRYSRAPASWRLSWCSW